MWYVATSATVANGSTVVAINNGDDISNIQEKSALVFEDGSPVEVVRAYLDGGGNKFIQLARPWASTSRSNSPLVVFPTDADFTAATAELRRVIDTLQVASTVEAQQGANDTKIMTPKKVKQAVELQSYTRDNADITFYKKTESDGRFVNKSNIVGTVSQSGGIPTGAIIESGSNANGRYTKYADGTMICTGNSKGITATTSPRDAIFLADGGTLPFPTSFSTRPEATLRATRSPEYGGEGLAWTCSASTRDITLDSIRCVLVGTNATVSSSWEYVAVGRWY